MAVQLRHTIGVAAKLSFITREWLEGRPGDGNGSSVDGDR